MTKDSTKTSLFVALWLGGCPAPEANDDSPPPASSAPETTAAPATAAPPAASPDEACFRHVLVSYAGAQKAPEGVHRSQEEARSRAAQLLAKIQGGATLESVAASDSDDERSKPRGGLAGTFRRAEVPPEMQEGIFALDVGAMSPAPVETPRGYHIFQRCPVEKVRARHILVRYRGAKNDRGATRSKAEARRTAEEIRGLATKAGADFAALARERSEDGSASRGGDLGEFGRGRMVAGFDETVFRIAPNEVSEVVETEFGFHVIQRLP